jgi:hypothetical protein
LPRDRDGGSWIERQADLPDDEISLLCAELDSDGSGSVSLEEVGRRSCCTALPPGQQIAPCVRLSHLGLSRLGISHVGRSHLGLSHLGLPPGQQTAPCVRMVGGHPTRHSGRTDSVRS